MQLSQFHAFKNKNNSVIATLTSLLLITSFISSAEVEGEAVAAKGLDPLPRLSFVDRAGVDVISNMPTFSQTDLKIGSGVGQIEHTISPGYNGYFWGFRDSVLADVKISTESSSTNKQTRTVSIGFSSDRFWPTSATLSESITGNGATLEQPLSGPFDYIYTSKDGVEAQFSNSSTTTIRYPNGLKYYQDARKGDVDNRDRIVRNNAGYALVYKYADYPDGTRTCESPNTVSPNCGDDVADKLFPIEVIAINASTCDPALISCQNMSLWPRVSYTWPFSLDLFGLEEYGNEFADFTVTDGFGGTTVYRHKRMFSVPGVNNLNKDLQVDIGVHGIKPKPRIVGVKLPTSSGKFNKSFEYSDYAQCKVECNHGSCIETCSLRQMLIDTATIGDAQWTYDHSQPDTIYRSTGSSEGPTGNYLNVVQDTGFYLNILLSVASANMKTTFETSERNLPLSVSVDGVEENYEYDSRGNLTTITRTANTDSSESDLIRTANYPDTCVDNKLCNKPMWVEDFNGYKKSYSYHSNTGQLKSATYPANEQGITPQTRYRYEEHFASYYHATGSKMISSDGIWLLKEESFCKSGNPNSTEGCSIAGDLVKTSYEYNSDNLLLTSKTTTLAGVIQQKYCFEYDELGNLVGKTEPADNSAICQ
ncbi:hypothetical protein [Salinimonas chungwhensis]|uniref:hypothetical protein n=1 Tax=Salinimonas chungwhensis TaxID=265425 RepID=UPI00036B17E5|nr:hypothetical protein [Salinimonas chungwhensis]